MRLFLLAIFVNFVVFIDKLEETKGSDSGGKARMKFPEGDFPEEADRLARGKRVYLQVQHYSLTEPCS